MPGRAAYMDGHSGASSMRLNFAGVPDADIREGIRRVGRVLAQQVGLLGTLSGSLKGARDSLQAPDPEPAARRDRAPAAQRQRSSEEGARATASEEAAGEDAPLADVVALPRRQDQGPVRGRRDR